MSIPIGSVPGPPIGYLDQAGTAQSTSPAAATPAPANDTLGKDAFLQLLVAQLRYQDPTNPVDSAQFMAQTAQFTAVEQLTELASAQTTMIGAQAFLQAAAVVGRVVTWTGPDGQQHSGLATAAQFDATGPALVVGTDTVPISAITGMQAAPAETATTATSDPTTPASTATSDPATPTTSQE